MTDSKNNVSKDVSVFFDGYAHDFSSIYKEDTKKRSSFDKLMDKWFRKDIEDRFTDPEESETTELGDVTPTEETPYGRASSIETPYTFVGYGYLY